ncbi:hypothetical protein GCM10009623_27620 [Nocardioides aestuarii]
MSGPAPRGGGAGPGRRVRGDGPRLARTGATTDRTLGESRPDERPATRPRGPDVGNRWRPDPALTCGVARRLAKMGEPADRTAEPSSPQVPARFASAYGVPAVATLLVRLPDRPQTSVVVSVTV